jgi:uncharacterized protein YkvS
MEKRITDLLDCIQDDSVQLQSKDVSSIERIKEATLNKIQKRESSTFRVKKKLSRTALVAAIVAEGLIISALAVGITLLVLKQAELRSILGIEDKNIPEYMEYEASETPPEADEVSVSVLSSMRDKKYVRYYILVSPVTQEQAESYTWSIHRNGERKGREAFPVKADLDTAYDADTQSLMLEFSMFIGSEDTEPYEVNLWGGIDYDSGAEASDSISTSFSLPQNTSEISTVLIQLGNGVEFTNSLTGETGKIQEVQVSSGGIEWFYSYDTAEMLLREIKNYGSDDSDLSEEEFRQYSAEQLAWIHAFEDTIRDAVLNLSDGSTRGGLIPVQVDLDNGVLIGNGYWENPLDLSLLESITVDGKTYQ